MAAIDTFYDLPESTAMLLNLKTYPGMTVLESEIVRAWLKLHHTEFDSVGFNIRMGTGQLLPIGTDPAIQKMAIDLTQKRADIVALKGADVTIVEVKIRLALQSLGQLLGYSTIWKAEHPVVGNVRLVAIARDAVLDAPDVLMAFGVTVETFGSASVIQPGPQV